MQPIFKAVLGPLSGLTDLLASDPNLANERMTADELVEDLHWLYVGDTPLFFAAAAVRPSAIGALLEVAADPRLINRRKATALHYACDPRPKGRAWSPVEQAEVIALLVAAGADPNARDMDGTAPLHRAVRSRSPSAVAAILKAGANPRQISGKGSSPMDLTKHSTGAGNTGGLKAARDEIVALLESAGA
jgi:ankyrin repeat protein